jgi:gentisate 1,2-dioxygenase
VGNKAHYGDAAKKRVFVREISGEYSLKDELKRLREIPRVIKSRDRDFMSGPQTFSKHYMEPEDGQGQTLHMHLEEYAPGGKSQMHGHVNEAIFYILDGKGFEIHDGKRYDWKAGDLAIVHNNCVHEHNNASDNKPARALVIKTKPMYLFMNMLFQKSVTKRPNEPTPTQGNFAPRDDDEVGNHPWKEEHDHDHAHEHAHSHEHSH